MVSVISITQVDLQKGKFKIKNNSRRYKHTRQGDNLKVASLSIFVICDKHQRGRIFLTSDSFEVRHAEYKGSSSLWRTGQRWPTDNQHIGL